MAEICIKSKKQELTKYTTSVIYGLNTFRKANYTMMREYATLFIENIFKPFPPKKLDERMLFSILLPLEKI